MNFMIKENELRIGNLINNGFKTVVVRGIDAEGILLSMRLVSRSFGWNGHPDTEYERLYLAYELAEPIPITTDILSKWGFEYNYYDGYAFQHPVGLTYTQPDMTKVNWRGGWVACQYLHQLQNIYFSLTGNELEVKL